MKTPQKFILKEQEQAIQLDNLFLELGISAKVNVASTNHTQIYKFLKILKSVYKKRKDNDEDLHSHYMFIASEFIGWTDKMKLIGQRLDIFDRDTFKEYNYWVNLSFLEYIKLDKSVKFNLLAVTERYLVIVEDNYVIICEKEDREFTLPIKTLILENKQIKDTYQVVLTDKSKLGFKILKNIVDGIGINTIGLYGNRGDINSFYLSIPNLSIIEKNYEINSYNNMNLQLHSDLVRISFGSHNLTSAKKSEGLAYYDINHLSWLFLHTEPTVYTLRLNENSRQTPLVLDTSDLTILIIPVIFNDVVDDRND